jgi:hypothetical protein
MGEGEKMKSFPLILPYPDSRLSANSRFDRRALTAVRKDAREAGYFAVKEANLTVPDVSLQMFIKICPPDNRVRDDDGVIASLKSYRDGIFKALGINDRKVRLTTSGFGKVIPGGAVYIWIEPLTEIPDWLEE